MVHDDERIRTRFGNAVYVALSVGETFAYEGHSVTLSAVDGLDCQLEVDGATVRLPVCRRDLPVSVSGVRIFVADNRVVAALADDPEQHSLCTADVLVCLSDASQPLLNSNDYAFPVGGGIEWTMQEDSHMWAYLGKHYADPSKQRSHEGIDIAMHRFRGRRVHPAVAYGAGEVVGLRQKSEDEVRVCLRSRCDPKIYFHYSHIHLPTVCVALGQEVAAGQPLGYVWGDGLWGHLHASVKVFDEPPEDPTVSMNQLNHFPQMYALYHGSLELRPRRWEGGVFSFGRNKGESDNIRRVDAYTPLLGYGWELGPWCLPGRVEPAVFAHRGIARLSKTLFAGTRAACVNPEDCYRFRVDLTDAGPWRVQVEVGNPYEPCWQSVRINGAHAGTYELARGELLWTPQLQVEAPERTLWVEVGVDPAGRSAGLGELRFDRA